MIGRPSASPSVATIPLHGPLLRGARAPRVALIGRFGSGKSTIFGGASSPVVHHEHLAGVGGAYQECLVDVGLDQISLVDLPSINSLHRLNAHDQVVLMYLLWGDQWPLMARPAQPAGTPSFAAPDVLVHVVDATSLEKDLQLTLELTQFGRPMVVALNRLDEARRKGLFINIDRLAQRLGVPVIPTIAHMGKGITHLFEAVIAAARQDTCPLPQPPTRHIAESLQALKNVIAGKDISTAFQVPRALLLAQLAENDAYFLDALKTHFPETIPDINAARQAAESTLPRALPDEVLADRHHRAAQLYDEVTTPRGIDSGDGWRRWLDALFLHPRWGLAGCLLVFALVLFVVFEASGHIDSWTSAQLAGWVQEWRPESTLGVVGRAVAEGLVGLVGIVAPYMLPLVLLLVSLEESGVMHRVAFVVDRGFHRIGLHGGVALPFLIGMGCNVPAISAAAASGSRRERVVSSLLITFVPCSARSAIILAIGGKYLGWYGVMAIFALTLVVIAVLGRFLLRRDTELIPGLIQGIPAYRLPNPRQVWRKTWERTEDIVTIVTPLLVVGSVVLALLNHWGADRTINWLLTPVTAWWMGLPVVLGVPILFGVLRKELSLLMIYQALGSLEIMPLLDRSQIFTFLVFLTFYVPCLSTFAVMYKTLGRRVAWQSVLLSMLCALALSGAARATIAILERVA